MTAAVVDGGAHCPHRLPTITSSASGGMADVCLGKLRRPVVDWNDANIVANLAR